MKKYILVFAALFMAATSRSQTDKKYPEPEFSNEVYYLKKESINAAVRLEKNSSKMETKVKMGGLGGVETG